jgi:hypothetical protein
MLGTQTDFDTHPQLRHILTQLSKFNIGFKPDEYTTMIVISRQVPLEHIINMYHYIFKLVGKTFLNININKKNAVNFLTSFIICYFPEITECNDADVLQYSQLLVEKYNEISNDKDIITTEQLNTFAQIITTFINSYTKWEQQQKNIEIENLAQIFWSTCAHIHQNIQNADSSLQIYNKMKVDGQTHHDGKSIDDIVTQLETNLTSWKIQYQNGFDEVKSKVTVQAKIINGDCGVKYLESLVPVFIDPTFTESIKELVHTVFWDALKSDLSEEPPKYDKLISLMKELKIYLMGCVPNRYDIHEEIYKTIDIELWEQMLKHGAHNADDIVNLTNYVYQKIEEWSAKQEISNLKLFREELDKQLNLISQNEITLASYVTYFLKNSFGYLEKIIISAKEFQSTDSYNLIKNNIEHYKLKK